MWIYSRCRPSCAVLAFALLLLLTEPLTAASKKPLDHDSYVRWSRISQTSLSNDGKWVLYTTQPNKGDAVVRLVEVKTGREYVLERSRSARFTYDGKYAVYLEAEKSDPLKKAVSAVKKLLPKTTSKSKTAPKTTTTKSASKKKYSLVLLELATGRRIAVPQVKSFVLPAKAAGKIAYLLEQREQESKVKPGASKIRQIETIRRPAKAKKPQAAAADQRRRGSRRRSGTATATSGSGTLAVRNLTTGIEVRIPDVASYRFSENGQRLAWTAKASASDRCGVFVLNTETLARRQLTKGKRAFSNVTFDKSGMHVAFFAAASSSRTAEKSLLYAADNDKAARVVAASGKNGFAKNRRIAPTSSISFSANGKRVFFSTVKRPAKSSKKKSKSPVVQLDIWHWKDPYLQPMQLKLASRERNRSYSAVAHLDTGKTVQLATETLPTVMVGDEQNADVGVGFSNLPYRIESSWDSPGYADIYLVDVKTGKRERVLKKVQARVSLSPDGKYLAWWDYRKQAWLAMDFKSRRVINTTRSISVPLYDETNDRPMPSSAYGNAGWLKGDTALLVYDKHDIWSVDPTGQAAPKCITEGYGRKQNLRLRRMRLDRDQRAIAPNATLLLSAFHYKTKASGFYRDKLGTKQLPQKLVMKDEQMRLLTKARGSKDVLLTRSTFQRYPDLWQSTTDFNALRRVSETNPQQKEYSWGKAELVEWKANDGQELQGILIKPENFNPKKKYPMLVYFYERRSDRLHSYVSPAPIRASINVSFYASRGYVVFIPDITYKTGMPGESAYNAVVPGVEHVVKLGFVDKNAIGVQGHSWGGYQVAYLVTRTNIFAAAESGAPVSNMTSAYGGIRWGSGMSRMFQYERTQSRIGGTLWEAREKYLKNSPLFRADKIETPLLILHNDKDGAVPWYQGIELFVALRRLSKPAWMLNYNGEDHGLTKTQNRKDFSIRMQQFFDHYLKGEPAPVWLSKGVPALDKGKVTGLDLEKPKTTAKRNIPRTSKKSSSKTRPRKRTTTSGGT